MKSRHLILLLFSLLASRHGFTQFTLTELTARPNETVSISGNLARGAPMPDLSWAWNSQNACFVTTKQPQFSGHHVLYRTEIPSRSEMTIRVVPRDKGANFSLYAYSGGGGAIVPNLPSCVSCEADYKWEFKRRGITQDHRRSVQLRAINRSYPVTIGVVGADGLDHGAFTLEVMLEGGEIPAVKEQAKVPLYQVAVDKGNKKTYQGQLDEGVLVPILDWAWSSQNACFPSTQQANFQGHHQLYQTSLPPYSELTITLVPERPDMPMNIYAYTKGKDLELIPQLNSCVSCEASYLPSIGLPASVRRVQLRSLNNPYQVVIGVAGAGGVTRGSYQLQLDLK